MEWCRKLKKRDKVKWCFFRYLLYDLEGKCILVINMRSSFKDVVVIFLKYRNLVFYLNILIVIMIFIRNELLLLKEFVYKSYIVKINVF